MQRVTMLYAYYAARNLRANKHLCLDQVSSGSKEPFMQDTSWAAG